MDTARVEAIVRFLNDQRSRRGMTRLLGGLTASALLVTSGRNGTAAQRKKRPKCICRKRKKSGRCGAKLPDGTACPRKGRCLNGTCNREPTCAGAGASCATDGDCCSGQCRADLETDELACSPSAVGEPCHEADDCASLTCVGYRCQPGEPG